MSKKFSLSDSQRLRRSEDFRYIFEHGNVASDQSLVVHGLRQSSATRLGICISRKTGGAVVRNRWKRLIREAFRLNYHRLPVNLALIVRPRRGAHPELTSISLSLVRLTRRLDRQALKVLDSSKHNT